MEKLAAAVGITRVALDAIERKGTQPRAELAVKLCRHLGLKVEDVWGGATR